MTKRSRPRSTSNEPWFLLARSSYLADPAAPTVSALALERDRSRMINLKCPVLRAHLSRSSEAAASNAIDPTLQARTKAALPT